MAELAATPGAALDGGFVHLRCRSAYSILEGAIKADALAALAAANGMPAVGVCDRANLFGALEFSQSAKDAGVQPIVGCALPVRGIGEGRGERWAKPPTIVLIAQHEEGFGALMALSSMAYLEGEGEPQVPWSAVAARSAGLILLSGGPDGPVDPLMAAGKTPQARAALDAMREAFGDRFYVELQRHGAKGEAEAEEGLVAYAYEHDVPLVATNDVHFGPRDMHAAHEALLCIADGAFLGQTERRRVTPEHRFKTTAEMRETFADLPEALRQHPRHRPSLRLPRQEARPDPAALPHRRRPRRGGGADPPGPRRAEGPPRRHPRRGLRAGGSGRGLLG